LVINSRRCTDQKTRDIKVDVATVLVSKWEKKTNAEHSSTTIRFATVSGKSLFNMRPATELSVTVCRSFNNKPWDFDALELPHNHVDDIPRPF
jgi:hypothetical protein